MYFSLKLKTFLGTKKPPEVIFEQKLAKTGPSKAISRGKT